MLIMLVNCFVWLFFKRGDARAFCKLEGKFQEKSRNQMTLNIRSNIRSEIHEKAKE